MVLPSGNTRGRHETVDAASDPAEATIPANKRSEKGKRIAMGTVFILPEDGMQGNPGAAEETT